MSSAVETQEIHSILPKREDAPGEETLKWAAWTDGVHVRHAAPEVVSERWRRVALMLCLLTSTANAMFAAAVLFGQGCTAGPLYHLATAALFMAGVGYTSVAFVSLDGAR